MGTGRRGSRAAGTAPSVIARALEVDAAAVAAAAIGAARQLARLANPAVTAQAVAVQAGAVPCAARGARLGGAVVALPPCEALAGVVLAGPVPSAVGGAGLQRTVVAKVARSADALARDTVSAVEAVIGASLLTAVEACPTAVALACKVVARAVRRARIAHAAGVQRAVVASEGGLADAHAVGALAVMRALVEAAQRGCSQWGDAGE